MSRYRVKVESYVVVEADNQKQASANGEQAVRKAVRMMHANDNHSLANLLGDPWERFGFVARGKPERIPDDE